MRNLLTALAWLALFIAFFALGYSTVLRGPDHSAAPQEFRSLRVADFSVCDVAAQAPHLLRARVLGWGATEKKQLSGAPADVTRVDVDVLESLVGGWSGRHSVFLIGSVAPVTNDSLYGRLTVGAEAYWSVNVVDGTPIVIHDGYWPIVPAPSGQRQIRVGKAFVDENGHRRRMMQQDACPLVDIGEQDAGYVFQNWFPPAELVVKIDESHFRAVLDGGL